MAFLVTTYKQRYCAEANGGCLKVLRRDEIQTSQPFDPDGDVTNLQ